MVSDTLNMKPPLEERELLYASTRKQWREWLRKNHSAKKEIWLVYYKKHSNKIRIPYNDAVEEALCFGWIDSTVRTIDENKYAQRFSPRKAGSAARIASSDPTMWRDVFLNNRDAVLEVLGRFNEDLSSLQRMVRSGDGEGLFDLFTRTRAIRRGQGG